MTPFAQNCNNKDALRVAVVGTGPAGMYSVEHLLGELGDRCEIDLYERLPTPWGLVRSAVAPDHPIKKQVIDTCFTRLLNHSAVRFFGNVEIGRHIQHAELAQWYDAVIYASGADGDMRMGIPGEELQGCAGAREFVHWYNGHPDFQHLKFDFSGKRAVIVGNGNVAMDVARLLTLPIEELEKTDMADYAIEALRHSAIEEVVILGRRGHLQGAFLNPELEELEHLEGVAVAIEGEELWAEDDARCGQLEWATRRKLATLHRLIRRKVERPRKRIVFRFLASPAEVLGEIRVEGLRVVRNELAVDTAGRRTARSTGRISTLETGLVLRSIGFRGTPFPGLPFDEQRNVMRNVFGRVCDDEQILPGVYVTGWLKRGPRGLIGTNKMCAGETIHCLLEDMAPNGLPQASLDASEVLAVVEQRQPRLVQRDRWWTIDRFEREAGCGVRPRAKLTDIDDLLECAFGNLRPGYRAA